tara:strand:- start:21 stop:290 length:270 start_codon:yes stop_codon:yes gene_type:complete
MKTLFYARIEADNFSVVVIYPILHTAVGSSIFKPDIPGFTVLLTLFCMPAIVHPDRSVKRVVGSPSMMVKLFLIILHLKITMIIKFPQG